MTGLLMAAVLVPLLAPLLLAMHRAGRTQLPAWLPWAPLPALALAALAAPGVVLDLPALLLGMRLGLDPTAQPLLAVTALLWTIAGWAARNDLAGDPRRARFAVFFLLTLAGNLGVIVARDIATFYLFFALLTFAAYGLVVHDGTAAAHRAGRVYIVMAVLGEALLLAAFLLIAQAAGTLTLDAAPAAVAAAPWRDAIVALLLAGFGIKAGLPLLHLWLPLAHPVAPTPASAVLSGVIIKAGLLGWLRFLPLGEATMAGSGAVLLAAGIVAMFFAVAVGLVQRDTKVILAYSSVSQMGFMSAGVGAGLLAPALWPALLAAVLLYAVHHALAKGALFLGAGVARGALRARGAVLAGLAWPALALAGAPLTSGMLAKLQLKQALGALPPPWPDVLTALLPLAALGTTLLMARLLWIAWRDMHAGHRAHAGLAAPWLTAVAASAVAVWPASPLPAGAIFSAGALAAAVWPVALGALLAGLAVRYPRRWPVTIPPGDVLVAIEALVRRFGRRPPPRRWWRWPPWTTRTTPSPVATRIERWLSGGRAVGIAVLALAGLIVLLLATG